MQYIKGLSQYESDRESAVTFGKFDGLHKGHQKLVSKVRELSKEHNVNSIVCAFDMHPLWERISAVPRLSWRSGNVNFTLPGRWFSGGLPVYNKVQPDERGSVY